MDKTVKKMIITITAVFFFTILIVMVIKVCMVKFCGAHYEEIMSFDSKQYMFVESPEGLYDYLEKNGCMMTEVMGTKREYITSDGTVFNVDTRTVTGGMIWCTTLSGATMEEITAD